jgi:4-hydroxybenzoate polyprenyltransferase
MPTGRLLVFWLKASRPGLWFQTLWLYLLGVCGATDSPHLRPEFWVGLAWVTFPLNLLVYGWNDIVDADIDRLNPRKDSFLFGARGSPAELATVPAAIVAVNLPFFVYLVWADGWMMVLMLAGVAAGNWVYNLPVHGLRGRPPFELLNEVAFLIVILIGNRLNHAAPLPWLTYVYIYLFIVHSHLVGEVMDIEPDRAAGRRTTATVLGKTATKGLIIVLVVAEAAILLVAFRDYLLGGFLAACVGWLLFDLLVWFKDRVYTAGEMTLFGWSMNLAGYSSMAWVYATGSLGRVA